MGENCETDLFTNFICGVRKVWKVRDETRVEGRMNCCLNKSLKKYENSNQFLTFRLKPKRWTLNLFHKVCLLVYDPHWINFLTRKLRLFVEGFPDCFVYTLFLHEGKTLPCYSRNSLASRRRQQTKIISSIQKHWIFCVLRDGKKRKVRDVSRRNIQKQNSKFCWIRMNKLIRWL